MQPDNNLAIKFTPKRTRITVDYTITNNVLGSGFSGKVVKCICTRTGVKRALKILEDSNSARREAELHLRASGCPNIVSVVDVYENNNENTGKKYILIVMECMNGGELFDRIRIRNSFTEHAPEILSKVPYDKSVDLWALGVIIYILLSGFPPFYSKDNKDISPEMESNIICGQYDFPSAYWKHISPLAKDLIKRLLLPKPENRLSISQVMQHPWLTRLSTVPNTPLATGKLLQSHICDHIHEAMENELRTMRRDYNNAPILKSIEISTNRLLLRRKALAGNTKDAKTAKSS